MAKQAVKLSGVPVVAAALVSENMDLLAVSLLVAGAEVFCEDRALVALVGEEVRAGEREQRTEAARG